jgi:hypothetical protein
VPNRHSNNVKAEGCFFFRLSRPRSNNQVPIGHRSGVSMQLRASYNKSFNTGLASKPPIHFSTSAAGQPVKQIVK